MPRERSNDPARDMLRDLRAADHLVRTLEATAPEAVAARGGAQSILERTPGRACAAGFWSLDMRDRLDVWEAIAMEGQAEHR